MNKLILLYTALFFSLITFNSCSSPKTEKDLAYEREYAKIANVKAGTPSKEQIQYSKPDYSKPIIGMLYQDFMKLCGDPNHISTYESRMSDISTYEYEFSDKHKKNGCWGRFTFIDAELNSISR